MARDKVLRVDVRRPWDADFSKEEVREAWAKVGREIERLASEGDDLPTQWYRGEVPEGVIF